jgi:aspartate aminotransferase
MSKTDKRSTNPQMSMILNDEALFKEWCQDIETMAQRIISMRSKLFELLTEKFKTPSPGPNGWNHVKEQIGMFTFTGLNRTFRLSATFLSLVEDLELM